MFEIESLVGWLLAVVGGYLVVMVGGTWLMRRLKLRRRGTAGGWSDYAAARRHLMSRAERGFDGKIREALDRRNLGAWRVHAQVAMFGVFEPVRESGGFRLPPWVLDFVLVDDRGVIRGIVELNDASHRRRVRQERDNKLEAGCKALGMPLLFVVADGERQLDQFVGRLA